MHVLVLFPHQLYFKLPEQLGPQTLIVLVEEYLFFKQYNFHKQKLVFHRASMQAYKAALEQVGHQVWYIETHEPAADARHILAHLQARGVQRVSLFEPDDFWLKQRLDNAAQTLQLPLQYFENQLFINSLDDLAQYQAEKPKLFQTDFYIAQRKKRNILLDAAGKPLDGKWSFDAENRKKYPSNKLPPPIPAVERNAFVQEAKAYVQQYFPNNLGDIDGSLAYPIEPIAAQHWLQAFFEQRFYGFGLYEDAIVAKASVLHHSVLTPMLNVGILKPMEIIQAAIAYAEANDVAYNNLEGFVRQILGWREFVRYVYLYHGLAQRNKNYWGFKRKIPVSFYQGNIGIKPVDDAIKKLLQSGYNHHIERLMVLSNFMLLCEFDPEEVYRWFMELYIDAYDWVMVPNVYGMAQFADGGLMCTKPYISGSNYIFKMSDYPKGEPWADTWDALFWRFMSEQRHFFKRNPRLSMLLSTFDKWEPQKRERYLNLANDFLAKLDAQNAST
jgi:deoxyribodipyrimidine photolyase-related protein